MSGAVEPILVPEDLGSASAASKKHEAKQAHLEGVLSQKQERS